MLQIFNVTKKQAVLYKRSQIFDKFLTVLLLLMLPFPEATAYSVGVFKILQKSQKTLELEFLF